MNATPVSRLIANQQKAGQENRKIVSAAVRCRELAPAANKGDWLRAEFHRRVSELFVTVFHPFPSLPYAMPMVPLAAARRFDLAVPIHFFGRFFRYSSAPTVRLAPVKIQENPRNNFSV
jgi:hypothetical protein